MTIATQVARQLAHSEGEVIEVRVAEIKQLFNAIDASPFGKRDLDPHAEEFIVGWAHEAPRGASLSLLVNLDKPLSQLNADTTDEAEALRRAVRDFFADRARVARTRLRQLLRTGRLNLLVGLTFLVTAVGLGDIVASSMSGQRIGDLLREGLVICGWVAMWRPLETLLYDWWPIRNEARLYDRLSQMPVHIASMPSPLPAAQTMVHSKLSADPMLPNLVQTSTQHHVQTTPEAKEAWRNEGNPN